MADDTEETVTETVAETPDVVVVEEPAPSTEMIVGALAARVQALEDRVREQGWEVEEAQATAEVALEEAVVAEDTAEDVGESVEVVADAVSNGEGSEEQEELAETADVVEDHSDSILPTKKHFVHRSWRELIGRGN